MSSEPLLSYEPLELSFRLDTNCQLSSSIRLLNNTDNYVAFKLKSTNPRNYVVRPRIGILLARSTCEIRVTMRSLREATHNSRFKDKFMIQSAVTAPDTTLEDARKLFDKDAGHPFHESILRVVYIRTPESSPRTSSVIEDSLAVEANDSVMESLDNGLQVPSSVAEPHGNDLQATKAVIQPRDNDSKEVKISLSVDSILRSIISKCTGESILREVIGSLLILVSLYLMKRTLSWIGSLIMFVMMLTVKMIKKLISDSVEDWIVKTLLHIAMYVLFGRNNNTGSA